MATLEEVSQDDVGRILCCLSGPDRTVDVPVQLPDDLSGVKLSLPEAPVIAVKTVCDLVLLQDVSLAFKVLFDEEALAHPLQ